MIGDFEKLKFDIMEYLKSTLSKTRLQHVLNVACMSRKLATIWAQNEDEIEIAALLHDVCKCWSNRDLIAYAIRHDVNIPHKNFVIPTQPHILHSYVGAHFVKHRFHISIPHIITAIRYHTLGALVLSTFDKIIFVSDSISSERVFDTVDKIRAIALEDIHMAYFRCFQMKMIFVLHKYAKIHPVSTQIWNQLVTEYSLKKEKNCTE